MAMTARDRRLRALAVIVLATAAVLVPPAVAHAQDLGSAEGTAPVVAADRPRMESRLADIYTAWSQGAEGATAVAAAAEAGGGAGAPLQGHGGQQTVRVVMEMQGGGMPPPPGMGILPEAVHGNLIQATVPIRDLGAIASGGGGVSFVRMPLTPVPVQGLPGPAGGAGVAVAAPAPAAALGGGATASEGAALVGAHLMNQAGYTGRDVRVAVIDTGFDVTSPEIGDNVRGYRSFAFGGDITGYSPEDKAHGTAVAEIIVDMAPDVGLYLYNFGTDVEFLSLVDHIVGRGDIDVVSMSLAWFNDVGPVDGTSEISRKVAEAADAGILWVNAAGNHAGKHWQGQFSDPDGDGRHNFRHADETIDVGVRAGETLDAILSWDDDWRDPDHDFDLYLMDGNLNVVARSADRQAHAPADSSRPYEAVRHTFARDGTAHIAVSGFLADGGVGLKIFSVRHNLDEYAVARSSITVPADSHGSLSVGAYDHPSDALARYSSQGPTLDGRTKPDISGPSGVATDAYHPRPFHGTSASAPHVAGAAALVMERHPGAGAQQVRDMLEQTTANHHAKSDRDGTGRVDLSMFPAADVLALKPGDPGCAAAGTCFYPGTARIGAGQTVTWANAHDSPVRIAGAGTAPDGTGWSLDSGPLPRGGTYTATFAAEGTYAYADGTRPWATGAVIVGPDGAHAPPPPPPPDADGDGIPDASDACPADPETFNGFEDADGCPDTVPRTAGQGARLIGADLMNGAGYTGRGVSVAVIGAGFDIANPEIAGNVMGYESFWAGGTIAGGTGDDARHGTAAAEVVVDVAPGAGLYLYNFRTGVEFLNLVDHVISRGDIDVVSMSLGWSHVAPRDGTSVLAQKVDEARDAGILWVSAAGNRADKHWEGRFSDPDGDGWHDFGPGDEAIGIDVGAGDLLTVDLSWDDWYAPSQDYDLYLYGGGGVLLDSSANPQTGGYPPQEIVSHTFTRDTTAHVMISNFLSDGDADFQLVSSHALNEHAVPGRSIAVPADSSGSLSVGAYDAATDALAGYSSQGPTQDGRTKPDLAAPTGVDTAAYRPEPFGGTSAAAPHVAGAAALVMERHPGAGAQQVRDMLEQTTANHHAKSDRDGTGRVDLSMFPGADVLALKPGDPGCAAAGTCFYPGTARIGAGQTVTWANAHDSPVRIAGAGTAPDGTGWSLDSGPLPRGGTYTATFAAEGTYAYADGTRPWATGAVIVGPAAPAGPDADGDGIPDASDACPADPETFNGFEDGDGCPDAAAPPPSPGDPTYSGARADTVGTITLTTDGPVERGPPRAADFEVRIGGAPYFALVPPAAMSADGTAITLGLPPDRAISSGDALKIRYNRTADSTSNLAAFPESDVANNVHVAPGGLATAPSATAITLHWRAIADAPPDGRYLVQSKQRDAPGGWGAPVDRGASGTNHTFGGLSPSTLYDLRAYLANGGGERISDHGTTSTFTAAATPAPDAAAVTGRVFNDTDRDRLPGDGEPGIPGINVLVYDYAAGVRNDRLTGAGGNYAVEGVSPGQSALAQVVLPIPPGHLPSGGIHSLLAYTPLHAGTAATVNFPLYRVPPAERGAVVFDVYHDANGNGSRDDGEPGVPGATVYTFELLTHSADVQVTGQNGVTVHSGLVPDVVLAQISYSDPATGQLLLPGGFTRITTPGGGAEYFEVAPGSTEMIQIGLAR